MEGGDPLAPAADAEWFPSTNNFGAWPDGFGLTYL